MWWIQIDVLKKQTNKQIEQGYQKQHWHLTVYTHIDD